MTLNTWLDGILDGRKGDVLVLHGLCLLMEWHTWVHLNDGKVWTSLRNLPKSHEEVMDQCNLHLTYLGQGIYAILMERPLATKGVSSTTDISLSANEIVTINMLMLTGLGVGLSQPKL